MDFPMLLQLCRRTLLGFACITTGFCNNASTVQSAETTTKARQPDALVTLWEGMAPGESTNNPGNELPRRPNENPPATRVTGITQPAIEVYYATDLDLKNDQSKRPVLLIFPGGAYNYVVRDKEGSEIAAWANKLGITACVLRYRTKREGDTEHWRRPLQDAQRAIRYIRTHATEWKVDPDRIGVIGFSAGGQLAALTATRFDTNEYEPSTTIDSVIGGEKPESMVSCRPDYAMLLYPWQLVGNEVALKEEFSVTKNTPPTFLVHTHDDSQTSLSSIAFYIALKKLKIPAELHIYETGGHGYGLRPVDQSNITTWPDRGEDWLRRRQIIAAKP